MLSVFILLFFDGWVHCIELLFLAIWLVCVRSRIWWLRVLACRLVVRLMVEHWSWFPLPWLRGFLVSMDILALIRCVGRLEASRCCEVRLLCWNVVRLSLASSHFAISRVELLLDVVPWTWLRWFVIVLTRLLLSHALSEEWSRLRGSEVVNECRWTGTS